MLFITACGGGGGGGSSAPAPAPTPAPPPPEPGSVADDAVTLEEDNTVSIDVLANDSNVTSASLAIASQPANGSASIVNGQITYTPAQDYVGDDALTYSVDGEDGASLSASVSITVTAITVTSLEVRPLSIPTTGYVSVNDSELGVSVLSSPAQQLEVPPNTISVMINLSGPGVDLEDGGMFVSSMTPPSGPLNVYQRFVGYCSEGLCSGLIPKTPDIKAEPGTWSFRIGTRADSLEGIDLGALTLTAVIRTGPKPNLDLERPAAIQVRPYLTSTTLTVTDIDNVMARYQEIAELNRIEAVIAPVTVIDDEQFREVSSSFLDATTEALVSMGEADAINLFFIEDFSDARGLLGRSGGIPGKTGSQNAFNGTLLDLVTLREGPDDFFYRSAADIAFHESGHLMGLYHTTEGDFSAQDVLDDTPVCEESVHDTNNNGFGSVEECPDGLNPMFWTTDLTAEKTTLTEDQQYVIFHSPLAVPGSE